MTERYYQPGRGDVILNPLDARCPSWNPAWELSPTNAMAEAEAHAMGTSLYVGRAATTQDGSTFFSDKSIAIWTHLNAHTPPAEARDLAYWMGHEEELDRRLMGSECEGDINKNSPNQRNGILASFRAPKQALASIPTSKEAPHWTVREWCEQRRGWIFLTATPDTAAALRPLQSLWIDMLIRLLMAQRERPDPEAPWFFFDELGGGPPAADARTGDEPGPQVGPPDGTRVPGDVTGRVPVWERPGASNSPPHPAPRPTCGRWRARRLSDGQAVRR